MKIVIVTAYYEPIPVPRAFRATELAKEFVRRGHDVTVFNTTSVMREDGQVMVGQSAGVNLVDLDIIRYIQTDSVCGTVKGKLFVKLKTFIREVLFYFTTNTWLKILFGLEQKLKFDGKYDLLISIGLPFTVHWAVSRKIDGHNIAQCYIADYGDPFSRYNQSIKVAKYFQWIEKKVIRKFDYISVPTELAVASYLWLKDKSAIKVIPQGFNFSEVKQAIYQENKIPTFGYAGLFYSDIRNPCDFFEFLCCLDFDFHFIIYTNLGAMDSYSCIEPYIQRLGSKLKLNNNIPRLELIHRLSKMDFIINVSNNTTNQIPSKLVDYTLSGRPIFSFSQDNFDSGKFIRFCRHNYEGEDKIDISGYDIQHVADEYEALCIFDK